MESNVINRKIPELMFYLRVDGECKQNESNYWSIYQYNLNIFYFFSYIDVIF